MSGLAGTLPLSLLLPLLGLAGLAAVCGGSAPGFLSPADAARRTAEAPGTSDDLFFSAIVSVYGKNGELWNSASPNQGQSWEDYNWKYDSYDYMSYDENQFGGQRYTTWGDFYKLWTAQFIIAGDMIQEVTQVKVKIDMSFGQQFRACVADSCDDYSSGDTVVLANLDGSGDPLHITIFAIDNNGVKVDMIGATWISFRRPWVDDQSGHYCHLTSAAEVETDKFKKGFSSNSHPGLSDSHDCELSKPQYVGWNDKWDQTCTGVKYLDFRGPLVDMSDGQYINIHLDDFVDVDVPLTNNYARHTVNGAACDWVCNYLVNGVGSGADWDSQLAKCDFLSSEIFAAENLGRVRVSGFGRINGFSLQSGSSEYGKGVKQGWNGWNKNGQKEPKDDHVIACTKDNGNQNAIDGCEFYVMGGLLHLAQDQPSGSQSVAPVDIFDVAVAFGPAIGDGAVLVNPGYAKFQNGGQVHDNWAKLFDVKTPGSFVDAADGPNVFGTGSQIANCYLQHADDTVKMSAWEGKYWKNTVLHGNTGSAVLLGNFGLGLLGNGIQNAELNQLYVHYVWLNGTEDQQGAQTHTGLLGMQTCLNPSDTLYFDTVTVEGVWVADHGPGRTKVNRAISMGTLDPQASPAFCEAVPDQQTFINDVWLKNLYLKGWNVYPDQDYSSLFFSNSALSGQQRGELKVWNIQFYDRDSCGDYQGGLLKCFSDSAVKIFNKGASDGPAYLMCPMDKDTWTCMNTNGAFWQDGYFCEKNGGKSCQNLEIFQVSTATWGQDGTLWFPTWNQ